MNTILGLIDKIYSDTKMLSIYYIIGAILLLLFILLLIISLKKDDVRSINIIDDEKNDNNDELEEDTVLGNEEKDSYKQTAENNLDSINSYDESIFEKTTVIPVDEINDEETKENIQTTELSNTTDISSNMPDIDEYVENAIKETYEQNDKENDYKENEDLNQIMEDLNVDKLVKDNIILDDELKKHDEKTTISLDDLKAKLDKLKK